MICNSEYLTYNMWYENFLEGQGYPMKSKRLWQENEESEKMAKNRKCHFQASRDTPDLSSSG